MSLVVSASVLKSWPERQQQFKQSRAHSPLSKRSLYARQKAFDFEKQLCSMEGTSLIKINAL